LLLAEATSTSNMSIRIATAPVSWGILEIEGWTWRKTYTEVLDEMVQAGYSGTELGPYGFLPTNPNELKRELGQRKLSLLGAFVPLPLADAERHQAGLQSALEVIRLLADAGAPILVLADSMDPHRMDIAGSVTEADGLSDEQWKRAAELVNTVALRAREQGLRSAFHHHAGSYVETPRELDRLLTLTDPHLIGICLDTGHYFYGGGDPVECARTHAKRVWHLHLKDIQPEVLAEVRHAKIPYLDAVGRGVFCELGQGAVDLVGVIHELQRAGFDGWGVFEQDVDPALAGPNPLESAVRSRAYLKAAARV
jgi:inosose dehydratase